jgi:branched-chain amino acid transport system permease protein/neutral amino acid transport system permease protein
MFLHAIGFGIVTAAVMALAAVGFTVQFGVTNILNLAYGDVMTASAFVAYVTYSAGLNPWWGMVFGGLFGAVFSVLLNRFVYTPFIRRGARLFTMIIVTIAMRRFAVHWADWLDPRIVYDAQSSPWVMKLP